MPNTREKFIEACERTLANNGTGREMRFVGGDVTPVIANSVRLEEKQATSDENKWIPVTERLPEDNSNVLAYLRIGEEGRIYPAHYAKKKWFDCIFNTPTTRTTTHWMPLPEPPKGE